MFMPDWEGIPSRFLKKGSIRLFLSAWACHPIFMLLQLSWSHCWSEESIWAFSASFIRWSAVRASICSAVCFHLFRHLTVPYLSGSSYWVLQSCLRRSPARSWSSMTSAWTLWMRPLFRYQKKRRQSIRSYGRSRMACWCSAAIWWEERLVWERYRQFCWPEQ